MAITPQPVSVQPPTPREKKRGCFSYVMFFLGVGVLFIGWFLWTVASTGLVRIPVFSRLAFREPTPTHIVEPSLVDPASWFSNVLVGEITRSSKLGSIGRNLSITIPEGVLTTFVRASDVSSLSAKEIPLDFSRVQVATVDGTLEVFLPIKDSTTAVTVQVTPSFEEGELKIVVDALRVGSWGVPKFVLRGALDQALDVGVGDIQASLEKFMTIQKISVSDFGLVLTGVAASGALTF